MEQLSPDKVRITEHAAQRALDMAIHPTRLRAAIFHPDVRYYSGRHKAWTYQRDGIGVGIRMNGDIAHIVTVVWADDDAWASDADRAPLPEGRYTPKAPTRKDPRARR